MNGKELSRYTTLQRHQGSSRYFVAAIALGTLIGVGIYLFGVIFEIDHGDLACWTLVGVHMAAAISRMLLEAVAGPGSRMVRRLRSLLFLSTFRRHR